MNDSNYIPPPLPAREPAGHKGTFGTVGVVGGCAHGPEGEKPGSMMVGAPALAALAALRSGAGLAHIGAPAPILAAVLNAALSATGTPLPTDDAGRVVPHLAAPALDKITSTANCLVIGPGMGIDAGGEALVVRALAQSDCPVVLDADGLNHLCRVTEAHLDLTAPTIMTPHPGEFRRLADAFGISVEVGAPGVAAAALARRLGCIVVLKGAVTAVSDGHDTWMQDRPNPALATGGSGDVLAGVIAAIAAQFHPRGPQLPGVTVPGSLSLIACACLGVRIHAAAADAWCEAKDSRSGMLAVDLTELLPEAMGRLRTIG